MDKTPEYKFLDDPGLQADTAPIQILSGEYAGIIYRYGKISMKEIENEQISVSMEVEIVKAPEGFDQKEQKFTQTIGEIFVDIVENNSTTKEPIDLEDDVHQDVDNQ
jgi:hypothetical protein